MAKAKPDAEIKIAETALRLAARQGWGRLTLDQIAHAAKISPAQAKKHFSSKEDIFPAVVRFIDAQTAVSVGKPDRKASQHDRIFEVMMARMDVLQKHRRAILALMDEVRQNPRFVQRMLPAHLQAMRSMLKLAGIELEAPREMFAVVGLGGIYALTLWCWRTDSSPDMAKTMAALDRYLRRIASLAEILFRPLP